MHDWNGTVNRSKYEAHVKCPSCMLGKATLEHSSYLGARVRKVPPLYQINMDSFSSSIKSIEGYNHAVVLVDNQTGYRWVYGMKTKDEMIKVVKQWYSTLQRHCRSTSQT
jgi:hypothetical protein